MAWSHVYFLVILSKKIWQAWVYFHSLFFPNCHIKKIHFFGKGLVFFRDQCLVMKILTFTWSWILEFFKNLKTSRSYFSRFSLQITHKKSKSFKLYSCPNTMLIFKYHFHLKKVTFFRNFIVLMSKRPLIMSCVTTNNISVLIYGTNTSSSIGIRQEDSLSPYYPYMVVDYQL